MKNNNRNRGSYCTTVLAGLMFWIISATSSGSGQAVHRTLPMNTIRAGTTIIVRTLDDIDTDNSDRRVYRGVVAQDVLDKKRHIIVPRSSDVELIVRKVADDQVAIDLDSITINGQRFSVDTESVVDSGEEFGTIIGAIAGGSKGNPEGGGSQFRTSGKSVLIPPRSLLTFKLRRVFRVGAMDSFLYDGFAGMCIFLEAPIGKTNVIFDV